MKSVLYITYDGLLDPLGASQVQPYLRGLGRAGVSLRVVSFEKPGLLTDKALEDVRQSLAACGVAWYPLRYHKRPATLATAWDILRGALVCLWLAVRYRIGLVHARSYIAALIARAPCALPGRSLLFDMRGFWADERVEGGLWPDGGLLYRVFKRLEGGFLRRADGIVVLTRRGAEVLRGMLPAGREGAPVAVIPTCADLGLFRPPSGGRPGAADSGIRLVYLGSLGTWYLLDEMLSFFGVLQHELPGSTFRIVTPADPRIVREAAARAGLGEEAAQRVTVDSLPYSRVPESLGAADCSIFFIRPTFSKQASCATKFAESLACGLPVLINAGIGDQDSHVRENRVGVVLETLDPGRYKSAVSGLRSLLGEKDLAARCRAAAERDFSLEGGVRAYLDLYRRIG